MTRRLHHAADHQARSGNIVPFASRKLMVSVPLRLFLRTSREAGLLRLAASVLAVAAASIYGSYVVLIPAVIIALVAFATSWKSLLPRQVWEDPSVVGVNRLATHSRLGYYTTFKEAAACGQSPNVVSLSGTWKFLLADAVAKTPKGFESPEFSDSSWGDIRVPGHWQLQTAGARDPPIYTNTNYPFPNHPPYAPRKNPTGLYRRGFALPPEWLFAEGDGVGDTGKEWDGRFVVGQRFASPCLRGRVILAFQGVDSAFHVWVNGILVGFAKGSRLPCEFDVTDALRGDGEEQCLCLRVIRWSDGSYLEDQDHWWLSGVYREVELALRPAATRISDFSVRPFLDEDGAGNYTKGSLEVEVLVEHDLTPRQSGSSLSPTAEGWGPIGVGVATARTDGASISDPVELNDDRRVANERATFSLEQIEEGEDATIPQYEQHTPIRAFAKEDVSCALLDTTSGERFALEAVGELLPDWQIGIPPAASLKRRGHDRGMLSPPPPTRKNVHLFRLDVPGAVRAWSAESPQLYTLVVSLRSGHGRDGEEPEQFESARVGFRSVRVVAGQVLVNGRAVMFAGVNRHEHDPDTAKTVSEESMRRDILMMKRFNFNAVRNCHYPNHWRWYELCDELGLYVCDEANIESHGQIPLCRLSADPSWRVAYLDRVWRMLAANKNHACIVLWSLGNESGDGSNLAACRRLVKNVDPSRPVVYEGGGRSLAEGCGCTELTDVVCPMYTTVPATERLGTDGPGGAGETRPCVLCEYSHAMGNSNGNLQKYWEIFRKHRRLQGGFIWDWVDQGLTKVDSSTGRRYWADGSGFGGRHSEGYDLFCVNGLTFPDRSPHPALWEAKFLAQPMGMELLPPLAAAGSHHQVKPVKSETVRLLVTNRYDFLSLEHLSVEWRLQSATARGKDASLASGSLPLSGLLPGQSCREEIDLASGSRHRGQDGLQGADSAGEAGQSEELFLHVEARLKVDSAWARAGHLVAWVCLPIAAESIVLGQEASRRDGSVPSSPSSPAFVFTTKPVQPSALVATTSKSGESEVGEAVAVAGTGTGIGTGAEPRPSLIVYENEEGSPMSSAETSPLGQLREQLLTEQTSKTLASSVIVLKGLLARKNGVARAGGGARTRPTPKEWKLVLSRRDGSIVRFMAGGVDLIQPGTGVVPSFSRAATDNDRAGWPTLMNFVADHRLVGLLSKFLPLSRHRWKASGLCASDPPIFETTAVRIEKSSGEECVIRVAARCLSRARRRKLFNITTEIRVSSSGKLELTKNLEPVPRAFKDCVSLARVGVLLKAPAGFGHVEWFGKGPFECYQDRQHGAVTDVFSGTVEDQHVPYINPSENGGKADVRWMALRRGEGGPGILLKAETGTTFEGSSCSLYSAAELQDARRAVDLPLRTSMDDPVHVHLDHRSMGVGGDNSWYPNVVHEEYRVPANRAYRFRLSLEALVPGESTPLAASDPPTEHPRRHE